MNEKYVREKNSPLEAIDVNVWGQVGRQTTQCPHPSTGFIPDCHWEGTVNKSSHSSERNDVEQVPYGHDILTLRILRTVLNSYRWDSNHNSEKRFSEEVVMVTS